MFLSKLDISYRKPDHPCGVDGVSMWSSSITLLWHSECSPAASVSPWFQLKQHAPGNISPGGPWSSVPECNTAATSSHADGV